jgi:hypothetical protein
LPAPKGYQPPGGSRKGIPNKLGNDVREMLRTALDQAGGVDYLVAQAHDNPKAFMALVGKLIPQQLTGKDDAPLIPEHAADPDRIAAMLISLVRALPAPALRARIEDSSDDKGGSSD